MFGLFPRSGAKANRGFNAIEGTVNARYLLPECPCLLNSPWRRGIEFFLLRGSGLPELSKQFHQLSTKEMIFLALLYQHLHFKPFAIKSQAIL
jgi:hypothetical protein